MLAYPHPWAGQSLTEGCIQPADRPPIGSVRHWLIVDHDLPVEMRGERVSGTAVRRSASVGLGVTSLLVATLAQVTMSPPPAQAAPQVYSYTGSAQLYVVPPGVTSIQVTLKGAGGLTVSGGGTGGEGGEVSATVAVQPGESLMFVVGGQGLDNAGSFNGGGRPGGGGATDIRRPTPATPLNTASSCAYDFNCGLGEQIIVAGGGGGGGNTAGSDGGDGGNSGTGGTAGNLSGGNATGGGGATQGAGGTAGTGTVTGPGQSAGSGAGTRGYGGANGWAVGAFGGGGGGGYFGGGQGGQSTNGIGGNIGAGGGGGGSSWAGGSGVSNATFQTGGTQGHGSITVDPPSAIQGASFGFTGSAQTYTVPSDVTELSVRITGGGSAAQGDTVYGRLPVTPAQVVQINIGSSAVPVSSFNGAFSGGSGGWNGGGNSSQTSTVGALGGGGASDIRVSPYTLDDRVVVAGGGGGCYSFWCPGNGWNIGKGGQEIAGPGGTSFRNSGDIWYGGGSLTRGGAWLLPPSGTGGDDTSAPVATVGAFGVGGSGDSGGGGGYWGGAGGSAGGGGSSYASVTGPDPTRQGVGNVLGAAGAPFQHDRGGSSGDGIAVITAMPIGVTTSAQQVGYTSAFIRGSINPKYLASTPTVFYSTNQTTVTNGGGSSAAVTGPGASPVLAGDEMQAVSGSITGLTAGTTYYYRVCAQSVAGNGCGAVQSFTTVASGFPYFTADSPDDSGVVGSAYTSYTFAASSSPSSAIGFGLASGTLPPGLTFDDSTGVLSGTPTTAGTYSFAIRATNANGTTTTSTITITIAAPPSAPVSVIAAPGNASATVSWSPPSSPGTYPVTSYQVTASPGGQSCLTSSTSCTISGLTNGTTYTFTVVALSGAGWGASAASGPVTPSANPAPTPAPGPQPLPAPLPPGGSSLTVNGVPQTVSVTPNTQSNGLRVSGDDFELNLDGLGPDGQPLDLGPDGVLILNQERQATSSGRGFLGRSDIDLYIDPPVAAAVPRALRSTGLYVGTIVTDSAGAFNGVVTLPDSLTAGDHVLQAVGLTASGQSRAVSIGVRVTAWIQLNQGTRTADGRHDRIRTTGDSAGILAGTRVTPWIRYSGQDSFVQGKATITIAPDGSFRWTRQIRKDKAVTAYISYAAIESNRVTWAKVR